MNTWLVSRETGGRQVVPARVHLAGHDRVALLLSKRNPASAAVLSEGVWTLSGPGLDSGAIFRTVSTSAARTPGMMVLRGVRVPDEGRCNENRTIRLIRDLLDLEVVNASAGCPERSLSDSSGMAFHETHDGSCA